MSNLGWKDAEALGCQEFNFQGLSEWAAVVIVFTAMVAEPVRKRRGRVFARPLVFRLTISFSCLAVAVYAAAVSFGRDFLKLRSHLFKYVQERFSRLCPTHQVFVVDDESRYTCDA